MSHKFKTLRQYLNVKDDKLQPKTLSMLNRVSALMEAKGIDGETAVALMQSYEEQNGNSFNISARLSRFNSFVTKFEDKEDLIGTVNDLGLLSTDALEERCRETGDWMPFMVRREVLKKVEAQPQEAHSD